MKKIRNISSRLQILTIVRPTSTYTKEVDPLEYVLLSNEEYGYLAPPPPLDSRVWSVTDFIPPVPPPPPLPGGVTSSDDIPEGSNHLYFTDARARIATLTTVLNPADNSHALTVGALLLLLNNLAASGIDYNNATSGLAAVNVQQAIDELAATKLSTSGGSLTGVLVPGPGGLQIGDYNHPASYYETQYLSSIPLLANQHDTPLSELSFNLNDYQGVQVIYTIKDTTTGYSRLGNILVTHDNVSVGIADNFTETEDLTVEWDAAISGSDVSINYTNGINDKLMKAVLVKIPI